MTEVNSSLTFSEDTTEATERINLFFNKVRETQNLYRGGVTILNENFKRKKPKLLGSNISSLDAYATFRAVNVGIVGGGGDISLIDSLKAVQVERVRDYTSLINSRQTGRVFMQGGRELNLDENFYPNPKASFGTWPSGEYEITLGIAYPEQSPDAVWATLATEVMPNIESSLWIKDESGIESFGIEEYISYIKDSLMRPYGDRLSKRVSYLYEISKEDPEEGEVMSLKSLRVFVYFIQSVPNLKYPNVVLTPKGSIVAEWRADRNRHFSVEFREDKYVHFVIFSPNSLESERPIRLSGIAPWENLENLIQIHNVNSWALSYEQ